MSLYFCTVEGQQYIYCTTLYASALYTAEMNMSV